MKSPRVQILPPLLTLLVLGVLGIHMATRPKPADAAPYHASVKAAADKLPIDFDGWKGREAPVDTGAEALLHPNVIISRVYRNATTGVEVSFLLVHCLDARDMWGHYPPVCYPGQGYTILGSTPVSMDIEGLTVPMTEYVFSRGLASGGTMEQVVYDLIILPDGHIVPDMAGMAASAKSYTRQFYGAGQLQLLFLANVTPEDRQQTVRQFLIENKPLIETILAGVKR